ncbi:cupin [Hyphomonas beringensis]|uniref:Cupin n=1 Tax=Hyphomonas beringensis TaxID=1280946 RepID=A0A062U7D7_9PROT|nr:cupin domain-containing protein [Hyphomonas beringensis]KCZ56256.1 cupin [Hyphomonas beringensis]
MPAISGDLGANEIIRLLNLTPHPEGGHYSETFRSQAEPDARAAATLIYYLLQADELSAWHRVDADEIWLWQAGGPLSLTLSMPDGKGAAAMTLGPDLRAGQSLQGVAPAYHWQTAETLGAWTLVSCIVAPGFEFSGFEMAPPDWRPDV